jgi:hypothetical protein
VAYVLAFAASAIAVPWRFDFEVRWLLAGAVVLLMSFLWLALVHAGNNSWYSTIIPLRRAEDRGFLVRRKDDVLLAIVSAVVGALVGSLLTLGLGRLL